MWDGSTATGSPAQSVLLTGVSTVSVNGATAGTALTVDFTNGDPLPAAGLTFTGVAGASNALNVIGTVGNDALTVNGTTVTESAGFGSAMVTYSNVSAIAFNGGTGSDSLTQSAQPGNGAALSFVGTTSGDSLAVNAGTFTFAAGAAGSRIQTITLGSLTIGTGAKVSVAHSNGHPNRAVLVLGGLTIAGSAGTLDLSDNAFNNQGIQLNSVTPVLTLPPAPALTYDGTNDVTAWVVPTLSGVAGKPAPTGSVVVRYYAGATATGTPLVSPPFLPGTYTVIASYAGDSNYLPATSLVIGFVISATTGATPLALAGPAYYFRLDADGQHLDVWPGTTDIGSPGQSVLLANVSSITVTGVSAGSTLTVDFGAGDPPLPSGVTFTGVAAAANTLNLVDTGDGTNLAFSVDAAAVDVAGPSFIAPVTYAGMSAINITPGTGTDTLTQLAQPAGALTFLSTTASDSVRVVNGTFTIPAGASGGGIHSDTLGNLILAAGTKVIVAAPPAHADRAVMVLNSLAIAGGTNGWLGQLDLSGNDLVVRNGSVSQITSMISSGYNEAGGASWSGQGITSSAAATDTSHLTALGVEANNDGKGNRLFGSGTAAGLLDNQNTVLTDVLVKYTYFGDANLDGKVDGNDYAQLDAGSASNGILTGWANGDFNYDGAIDGTDLGLLDNAFNGQEASLK